MPKHSVLFPTSLNYFIAFWYYLLENFEDQFDEMDEPLTWEEFLDVFLDEIDALETEIESTESIEPFTLIKVNKKWKFDLPAEGISAMYHQRRLFN